MRSFLFTLLLFTLFAFTLQAQNASKTDSVKWYTDSVVKALTDNISKKIKDSVEKAVQDSIRWNTLKAGALYPVIKNSEWSAAFPVKNVQDFPDPKMKYKLLFNMTLWSKDTSTRKDINGGFAEIGRIINLHVAAGVPKENLEIAIVVHGSALNAYLNNEAYQKKYKINNPNLDILKQFTAMNARLLACGQAELFFKIFNADMIPEVKTGYSAKVVLSTYQLKGYVLYDINEEN